MRKKKSVSKAKFFNFHKWWTITKAKEDPSWFFVKKNVNMGVSANSCLFFLHKSYPLYLVSPHISMPSPQPPTQEQQVLQMKWSYKSFVLTLQDCSQRYPAKCHSYKQQQKENRTLSISTSAQTLFSSLMLKKQTKPFENETLSLIDRV